MPLSPSLLHLKTQSNPRIFAIMAHPSFEKIRRIAAAFKYAVDGFEHDIECFLSVFTADCLSVLTVLQHDGEERRKGGEG
jgi:hypothetical protein